MPLDPGPFAGRSAPPQYHDLKNHLEFSSGRSTFVRLCTASRQKMQQYSSSRAVSRAVSAASKLDHSLEQAIQRFRASPFTNLEKGGFSVDSQVDGKFPCLVGFGSRHKATIKC